MLCAQVKCLFGTATLKSSFFSIKDPDAPGILEETRYWVTVEESRTAGVDIEP